MYLSFRCTWAAAAAGCRAGGCGIRRSCTARSPVFFKKIKIKIFYKWFCVKSNVVDPKYFWYLLYHPLSDDRDGLVPRSRKDALSAAKGENMRFFLIFNYFYGKSINSYSSSSSFPANHLDLNPRKQAAFSQHSCLPSSAPRTVTLKNKNQSIWNWGNYRRTYLNSLNSSLGNSQTFIAVFRRSMTECRKFPINCFDFVLH